MAHFTHKYDKSGVCGLNGFNAEQTFASLLQKEGFKVTMASFPEQMRNIDVIAEKNNQKVTFDVKSRKRISRNDTEVQDEFVWLEIKNTNGGLGSLFGTADRMAFEMEDCFVIVDRNKLIDFVKEKCNLRKIARKANEALYSNYSRAGRKDSLTLIKKEDILKLAKRILSKS
jgi:hypothetical protein